MNTKFVDPEQVRKVVEEQESLQVKTGVRAGQWDPPGPIICYGIEPGPIYA